MARTSGSETRQDQLRTLDDVDYIVDADSHVTESFDDLLRHIEEEYLQDLLSLDSARPMQAVFSNAKPTPAFPYQKAASGGPFDGDSGPDSKIDKLNELGIDSGIVDPTLTSLINTVNNSRYAVSIARAYNSHVLETYDDIDDLYLTMAVAPQVPDKAAEEIDERATEEDIVGVHLAPSGLIPPAGHRRYEPIYEAAQRHGLPVLFHSVTGCSHRDFPVMAKWNEVYPAEHAVIHPYIHMWHLTSLLFEGVPARYPDLDFVFQEAGLGWIPYMKFRLDDHYLEGSHEIPGLDDLPSEYITDQCYFTSQPLGLTAENGEHIAQFIEMIGVDNVMYSADLPHKDFDPPEELFDRIKSSFTAEDINKIMGGNAASLFGIERE